MHWVQFWTRNLLLYNLAEKDLRFGPHRSLNRAITEEMLLILHSLQRIAHQT